MYLSAQSIPRTIVTPFEDRKIIHPCGMSSGLSACGYDVRIAQTVTVVPGGFALASTVERFAMPDDLTGLVRDKSTLARLGMQVFNTVIEPGWYGYLTLELANHGLTTITLQAGQPIAQVMFARLDQPTDRPYRGKYQDQENRPVEAIMEDVRT